MDSANWIGPAIIAAGISSLVTATGWVVAHRRETRAEQRRRVEKIVDLQKALRAEIQSHAAQLVESRLNEHLADMVDRMTAAPRSKPFVPFVPKDAHDTVFRSVVREIHLLPTETVEPTVAYYSHIVATASLAEDLRGPQYQALSLERRIALYTHFIGMKARSLTRARFALAALDAALLAARGRQ